MFKGIEAVKITDYHLQRCQHSGHDHAGFHHLPSGRPLHSLAGPPGADTSDQKGAGEQGGDHHVSKAPREGGVEDHGRPAVHKKLAIFEQMSGRRLHPGVETQYPEGGQGGAKRHQERGNQVRAIGYPVFAEQHDAEERCFEKESGQDFIAQQRPGDIAGLFHKAGPVGTKLETHGDAGNHAHGKTQGKYLDPEVIGVLPSQIPAQGVTYPEIEQNPGQPHGDGRKQNMKTDVRCKLNTGKKEGINVHGVSSLMQLKLV